MKLRLRILNGPLKGKHAPIQGGIILGRGPGTLSLEDSKVSIKHAVIEQNDAGEWLIMDLGSTNGIMVDGQKVLTLLLKPKVEFALGQTLIGIEAEDDVPPEFKDIAWPEYFSEFIRKSAGKVKERPTTLEPFPKIVKLRWLRGLQIDWNWYLGYGPRSFGKNSCDFPIYDEAFKDLSFSIKPGENGPVLECAKGNKVLINKKPAQTETVLRAGDVIGFGDNMIEVSFVDSE